MIRDLSGETVLVTGATRGIGLAIALAFGRCGARCILTHCWGSTDEDELRDAFAAEGARPPLVVRADVSDAADTEALMEEIAKHHDRLDVFVSNAAGANLVRDLDDLTERSLLKTMKHSVWPTIGYIRAAKATFGHYPRYVTAISSTGPDHFSLSYDLVAASKAALETLCRYLNYRLRKEDCRINVVRTLGIRTDAFMAVFGKPFEDFMNRHAGPGRLVSAQDVANVVLALCGGLMDGMSGQVVTVDKGAAFADNIMRLYAERERLNL